MLKGIEYVVETSSCKEREELRDYIMSRKLSASIMDGDEGRQLIAISTGDVWFLSTIGKDALKPLHYKFYASFAEFKRYLEAN